MKFINTNLPVITRGFGQILSKEKEKFQTCTKEAESAPALSLYPNSNPDSSTNSNSQNVDYSLFEIFACVKKPDTADYFFARYKNCLNSKAPLKVMDLIEENISEDGVYRFLHRITQDKETAKAFIEEVTRDEDGRICPQKSGEVVKKIVDRIGGKEKFKQWYMGAGGYSEAFSVYAKDYLLKTDNIEELCEFMPNWGSWCIRDRFKQIQEARGESPYKVKKYPNGYEDKILTDGFTLGEVPKEFKDKAQFREFVDAVRNNLIEKKDVDYDLEEFELDSVKLLNGGSSSKCVISVNDKYVVKFNIYKSYTQKSEYYNEMTDSMPDSTYINAMIDYYTKVHHPGLSSEILFYDDYSGAGVYEYLQGEKPDFKLGINKENTLPEGFNELFGGLEDVGIVYTDYNPDNYIETQDGDNKRIKCIDSGHSIYFDLLKPGVCGFTSSLSTRAGFNPYEFGGKLASVLEK